MTAQKRAWWELSRTPAWNFSLSALWAVVAAFHWTELATDDDRAWQIFSGVVTTLAAMLYLASATAQLRRKRRDTARPAP